MSSSATACAQKNGEEISPTPLFPQHTLAKAPRPSRDEMNLAEFPLTVLSTRSNSKSKTLEFGDTIKGRDGEIVNRRWIITGADKFGLPTASDDEVLLGLIKLTVDAGFDDRKVFFTRYELLRILQWSTEGRSYVRLQRALDRLSGVRIKATNAFYDNESKSHSTRNFGIIDAYEINDGRNVEPKPSFFTWSDVLYKSFQVGFIKKLDLDFYLKLRSAVSKRLYRYLDKHFWYRSRVQSNLFTLAHEKVGISRNYRHVSSIRQQLDPALEELVEHGFVSSFEYVGKGSDAEIHIFSAGGKPRRKISGEKVEEQRVDDVVVAQVENGSVRPAPQIKNIPQSLPLTVIDLLVTRGLREAQARRLIEGRDPAVLERMRNIVEYYDQLCSTGSHLVNRSPIGFLYRAMERPENFVLPGESKRAQGNLPLAEKPAKSEKAKEAKPSKDESLESEYLVARKVELQRAREEIEPELLAKIRSDVEKGLANLRRYISPPKFEIAVDHGVEEQIARLMAFPEFSEWRATRRRQ